MTTTPEPEGPASAPPIVLCSCDKGRVFLHDTVWTPCNICDGTGDRMKNRNYRDGWNAALAESQAALDRMAAYDQRQQLVISDYADKLATARAQGEQSMRDAVLRWHHEQWTRLRARSGTNAFAGAYMTAHERSLAAIGALNVDKGER
jgi:hypothetical protein